MNSQRSIQDEIDDLIAREDYLYEKIEKEQNRALTFYKAGRIQESLASLRKRHIMESKMETFSVKRRELEKQQDEIESQKNEEEEYNNIMEKLKKTNKNPINIKLSKEEKFPDIDAELEILMNSSTKEKDEDLIQELKEELDIQADLKDLLMNKTDYASFYGPISFSTERTS